MHRSQQDPMFHQEGGSKIILHPADDKTAAAMRKMGLQVGNEGMGGLADITEDYSAKKGLREVDELGLPVDGYDYSKHLAEIQPGGTFISKSGAIISSSEVVYDAAKDTKMGLSLPSEVLASETEYGRMLEAITLRPDRMEKELRVLLEEQNDIDSEAESILENEGTLDDDFMDQLITAEKNSGEQDDAFDYDAHVARLMGNCDNDSEYDSDEVYDEDDMLARVSSSRPVRDIDLHFETVLQNEYGDDQIGELDNAHYDETVGGIMANDAVRLQEAMNEFVEEQISDKERGQKEIGATESNKNVKTIELLESEGDETDDENPEDGLTEGEKQKLLDSWGYKDRPAQMWDCETIVSTYSVLDNHPQLIQVTRKKKKKSPKVVQEDEVVSEDESEQDDFSSVATFAIGRDKRETSEEKRLRKKLVKDDKRMRRQEKKSTKEMYKGEKLKQELEIQKCKAAAAPPPGVTVFRL